MSGTGTTLSRRTLCAVAAVAAVGWGCKPKVDEKKLRKIVREELDRALGQKDKEDRKAPRKTEPGTAARAGPSGTTRSSRDDPKRRRTERACRQIERLEKRIASLKERIAKYKKDKTRAPVQINRMERSLDRMNNLLKRIKGSLQQPCPPAGKTGVATGIPTARTGKDVSGEIKKIGSYKYQIPRSYFTGFMIRSSRLASGARIIPWLRDGALKGFRLYAIRPGSPWSLMGFQNGDIVMKVDGKEITSSEKMLSIFTGVATANQMKLEVVRRGKTISFTYIIK